MSIVNYDATHQDSLLIIALAALQNYQLLKIQFEQLFQFFKRLVALLQLLVLLHTALYMVYFLSLFQHHLHTDTTILHLLPQIGFDTGLHG